MLEEDTSPSIIIVLAQGKTETLRCRILMLEYFTHFGASLRCLSFFSLLEAH